MLIKAPTIREETKMVFEKKQKLEEARYDQTLDLLREINTELKGDTNKNKIGLTERIANIEKYLSEFAGFVIKSIEDNTEFQKNLLEGMAKQQQAQPKRAFPIRQQPQYPPQYQPQPPYQPEQPPEYPPQYQQQQYQQPLPPPKVHIPGFPNRPPGRPSKTPEELENEY
jgi:hypothetical protein